MGYFRRLGWMLTGKSKSRLPDEMAILGAPQDLVGQACAASDEIQEDLFIRFARGKHACMLDWRATRDGIYEELVPILTADEKRLLPSLAELPEEADAAIACIGKALRGSQRALVHTESLGDSSFLILVPRNKESEFIKCVGPWLIAHDTQFLSAQERNER